MRLIVKRAAPRALDRERAARVAFADLSTETRQEMREALMVEQYGLCCFCMSPIRADASAMRLAHLVPQSQPDGRDRTLDWTNLFAACSGGERHGAKSPRETQHCDVRQGDAILAINPTNPRDIGTLSYRHSPPAVLRGAVAPHAGYEITSTNAAIARDLTENLNLNLPWLCDDRKAALSALLDALLAKGEITRARLELALPCFETARTGESLPPFAGFVAWWLRKRLGRR